MTIKTEIFNQFPVITSERLTLREIRLTDATEIYAMRSNGRVNQFITRDNMAQLEDAERLAEKTIDAYKNRQAIGWAGILRDNQKIIGTCGFNQIDFLNLRAEIGGEMSTDYWGKNIALEAVQTIVDFGFSTMNLHSIEAKVMPDNRGAIYLMEHIGFKKEAHFVDRIFYRGAFSDMAVYSMIKP